MDWWEEAAQQALERGAQLEALGLFRRAAAVADAFHAGDSHADEASFMQKLCGRLAAWVLLRAKGVSGRMWDK